MLFTLFRNEFLMDYHWRPVDVKCLSHKWRFLNIHIELRHRTIQRKQSELKTRFHHVWLISWSALFLFASTWNYIINAMKLATLRKWTKADNKMKSFAKICWPNVGFLCFFFMINLSMWGIFNFLFHLIHNSQKEKTSRR